MVVSPDNQSVNDLFNPTQRFLDLINQTDSSFDTIISKSDKNDSVSNRFLHVEGLRYKVETEDHSFYRSEPSDDSFSVNDDSDFVDKTVSDSKDLVHSAPVFLNISPTPASAFLAQLPQHLTSFINRFVEIIQQYRSLNGDTAEIRARFPSMNLDVVFSKVNLDEPMQIKLYCGSDSIQDLFKHNEDKLHLFLEKKLEMDVELELVFEAYNDQGQEQDFLDQDNNEDSTNTDDEDDPIVDSE